MKDPKIQPKISQVCSIEVDERWIWGFKTFNSFFGSQRNNFSLLCSRFCFCCMQGCTVIEMINIWPLWRGSEPDDKTHHVANFVLKATTHMRNSRQSENDVSHPKEEMHIKVAYTGMFWIVKGKNVHREGKNDKGLHDEHNSIKFLRRFRYLENAKMVLPTVIAPKEVVKKPNVNQGH